MEFLQWTETYSVGDPLMDAYHHIFFQMVQAFGRAMSDLSPKGIEERIAFLVDYTFMHFDSEERLLEEVGYPDLEAHKQAHLEFRERMLAIQHAYRANPSAVSAEELLALVQDWFAHHILGEDMRFKACVESRKP